MACSKTSEMYDHVHPIVQGFVKVGEACLAWPEV
jgi:hypothetical protein